MNAVLLECCACAAKNVKCGCYLVTATNCQDVKITGIICGTIVLVALIAKWALCSWKDAEALLKQKEWMAQNNKEENEYIRKQKADLLEKKLTALSKDTNAYATAIEDALERLSASTTKADKKG